MIFLPRAAPTVREALSPRHGPTWQVCQLANRLSVGSPTYHRAQARQSFEQRANLDVPVTMASRAEIYEKNAAECEREADRATTPALKIKYEGIARQWHEMAEQKKPSAMLDARRSN